MDLDICMRDFLNVEVFPTDLDEKFIESFTELYLPPAEEGLRKLENYCHGPAKNAEVLMAFYIEILRKMIKQRGGLALESSFTLDFLRENESLLMHTGSSTLKQLVFELLSDIESVSAIHPFKFDIDAKIHEVLSADQTSVYVRRAVENLAIIRLKKICDRGSGSSFLLWNLVESVLETDYLLIMDSISRVLLNFAADISNAECERLVHKAKNSRKIGLLYARLIATLLLGKQFGSLSIVSDGFCDAQTHATIVSELVECNRTVKKFSEADLLNLLVVVAGQRFNFIAPHLKSLQFSSKQTAREFAKTLTSSLSNPRLCSDQNVGVFSKFLRGVDDEMLLYPVVFNALKRRILKSPSLLKFFADDDCVIPASMEPCSFKRVFQLEEVCRFFSDAVQRVLIDKPEVSGWEEKDSALELLQLCGNHLDLDVEKLETQILHFAKFDESEFVRSSATNILIHMLRDDPSQMSVAVKEEVGQLKRIEDEANEPAGAQERGMQAEIEDIIKTMQNNCGLDDCVSKECY